VIVDFIREHQDRREPGGLRWGVEPICTVLSDHGVLIAPSTYYEWRDKLPSLREQRDEVLKAHIRRVWDQNFRVYGARKIWLVLNREGVPVARCTVERLMRLMRIRGVHRGHRIITTIRDDTHEQPIDRVNRDFMPAAPNRLWVADITYVSTWAGWVFVAFVIDAYARRILGWSVRTTMTTDLVLDALEQAIWMRDKEGHADLTALVGHSDHGSQYTSLRYGQRLTEAGITASTGTVGDSYDNALAETINGLYKTEVIKPRKPWRNVDQVEYATAEWVDWFNYRRIYEYCDNMSPIDAENLYYAIHNGPLAGAGVPH
jgi:putative transposase